MSTRMRHNYTNTFNIHYAVDPSYKISSKGDTTTAHPIIRNSSDTLYLYSQSFILNHTANLS